jgi:hypothetical protein|tara:strand:- start:836 stop:1153 length:318 start_codon:yes stop_codon:yes gene_type:complete
MTDINKGEIGQPLRVNIGEDISAATSAIIICQPEVGTTKEFTATVPATPVTLPNGDVLAANEYAEYTTLADTDLDYAGRWKMKLKATFSASDIRQTNYVKFRVLN